MQLNVYEILKLIESAKTRDQRIKILKENATKPLLSVLYHTFNYNIEFYRKDVPPGYKPDSGIGPGLSLSTLFHEHSRFYLFYAIGPLKEKRKNELLLTLLEGLEPKEADVVIKMFNHDLKVPGLTLGLVREVFPRLIP